jgi:hypothetical protein
MVELESLKLSSRFLSDKSSRLRFQTSSRSRFFSATGSRRLSRSSSNCGISPTSWAVTVAVTGLIAGSVEPERSSGRILAALARRTSMTSSNGEATSSAINFFAASTACLKRAGCDPVSKVVSTTTISSICTRLRSIRGSSTTRLEKSSSTSQMPTKECPSVKARIGFRPACSRQEA